MKRDLILIRHTKSPQNPFIADFDRPIKEDRASDAKDVGEELKKMKFKADLVISSPALRTKETAELVCKQLDYDKDKIKYDIRLYESSPAEYMTVVSEVSAKTESLVLVGHNPSITQFANIFLREKIDEIPTSGVIWLEFESDKWEGIASAKHKLRSFLSPKAI